MALPTSFLTLSTLQTEAGVSIAVYIILVATRPIVKPIFTAWAMRLYALIWALVIQLVVLLYLGQLDMASALLAIINGCLVVAASGGFHHILKGTLLNPGTRHN